MSRLATRNGDLAIALFWAVLAGLLAALGDAPTPLRAVVGLPLVLVLPGYVLLEALVPRHTGDQGSERIALTIGLSLAVCAIGALVLNLFATGLRTATWTALLSGITVLGAAAALARRRRPTAHVHLSRPRLRSAIGGCAIMASVAALFVAILISRHGAESQAAHQNFSQLWMLPSAHELTLGVRSEEPGLRRSTLELVANGRVTRSWTLVLAPEQTWVRHVPRPASKNGRRVVAELIVPGSATLKVWAWAGSSA